MTKTVQLRATTFLTSASVSAALADASVASSTSSISSRSTDPHRHPPIPPGLADRLRTRAARQTAHAQRCMYRLAGGGVTAFRVRDPDPAAVDDGRVLGLRFEIMSRGRFWRTYFVLLNRPYPPKGPRGRDLRVHRHTLPGCIPISGLSARHLPPPSAATSSADELTTMRQAPLDAPARCQQDLYAFARAVRRELVAYHNRLGVVADCKRAAHAVIEQASAEGLAVPPGARIVDMRTADAEAKQVQVEWADGRAGRVLIDDGGNVGRMVAFGPEGQRDWGAGIEVAPLGVGDAHEVEGLLTRLGVPGV
jgi:central kinetochore subunit Mal2/MCM21